MVSDFGSNLRRLRALRNQTQLDVAKAVGSDPGTISRWERGESDPQVPQIYRVAEHFGVKPGFMLEPAEPAAAGEESEEFRRFRRTSIGQIAERHGWLEHIRAMELPVTPTAEIYQDIAYALLRQAERIEGDGSGA